jgi:hypothetical protein
MNPARLPARLEVQCGPRVLSMVHQGNSGAGFSKRSRRLLSGKIPAGDRSQSTLARFVVSR